MALDRTWYNTLVDDDGSNTVGTLWNKAAVDSLMDAVDAEVLLYPKLPASTAPTTTGTQTALAIPSGTGDLVLYLNNATLLTIQGIAAGTADQQLTLISKGAGQVDLAHLHASGTALGKLKLIATTGLTSLAAGSGVARLRYDATVTQWRLVSHEQGAWIAWTPAWKGSTSQTGQVYSAQTGRYRLSGRTVMLQGRMTLTSLGTITGVVQVSGLPFPVANVGAYHDVRFSFFDINTAVVWLFGFFTPSTSIFTPQKLTVAATASSNLAQADLKATADVMFSGQYEVD